MSDLVIIGQVTPTTVHDIADRSGGTVTVDEDGNQGVDLPGGARADYGWWVLDAGDGYQEVLNPVEFQRRYRATGG